MRILVVDDDFLVAMNTTAMLEDLGHEAVEVHSGAEALRVFKDDGRFDLVITDQAMPQMTGDQLISAIRQIRRDIPVVLATGYAELPDGVAADVRRLSKPFFQNDLERILAQIAAVPVD
mgnify:CR=1 FL=1